MGDKFSIQNSNKKMSKTSVIKFGYYIWTVTILNTKCLGEPFAASGALRVKHLSSAG